MEAFSYNSFAVLSEAQKVAFFDKGVSLDVFESEKHKRLFLQAVFANIDNHFLRKKAIESLSLMCIFGETSNNNTALSVLLDVEAEDDVLVLSSVIKYLFLINEKLELDDKNIQEKIDQLRFHYDSEVASTAEYYTGLNCILSANKVNDRAEFIKMVSLAAEHFGAAVDMTENRQDAILLLEFCKLIKLLVSKNKNLGAECMDAIKQALLERRSSFIYSEIPNFELWIYKLASRIHDIVLSEVDEWLEISKELNNICCFYYSMIDVELNREGNARNKNIVGAINNHVMKPFYKESLSQHLAAIRRLGRETEDSQLKEFCIYLIDSIGEKNSKKKPDIDVAIQIVSAFPHVDQSQLKQDIKNCDLDDPVSIAKLMGSYMSQHNIADISSVTGNHTGDEIFHGLVEKIFLLLPNYPSEKFIEFKIVLSDIIRYMIAASSKKSSGAGFFKFLFNKDSLEKHLQESLCAHLEMNSSFGARYSREVSEVADGGRVDILYQSNTITIPIELKKTDEKPTNTSIVDCYLGQAQTYCYPYDQLGIFVLLDNSSKSSALQNPINDIRELFNVHHMEPYYEVEKTAPNYIVSVIVPGNKVTPSARSKYK